MYYESKDASRENVNDTKSATDDPNTKYIVPMVLIVVQGGPGDNLTKFI